MKKKNTGTKTKGQWHRQINRMSRKPTGIKSAIEQRLSQWAESSLAKDYVAKHTKSEAQADVPTQEEVAV